MFCQQPLLTGDVCIVTESGHYLITEITLIMQQRISENRLYSVTFTSKMTLTHT